MIIIGLIIVVFAAGFCCWLLLTLAIYAFPLLVGAAAGFVALHGGADIAGATLVGLGSAAISLAVIRTAFASANSPIVRAAVAVFFIGPAAFAGYHATLGLAGIGFQSEIWRHLLAIVGAILVSGAACTRVMIFRPRP
jgi:hypothetical protein